MRRRLTAPVVLVILNMILALLVPGGTWALDARSRRTSAVASPPTVTSVSPDWAYNYQETGITITGVDFTATPAVMLGNVPLSDVTFISSTTLTATVPADLPGGTYTLTVTNPDSQSAPLANAFTVVRSGDGSLGPWQAMSSMTTSRSGNLAAVLVGDYLYALGGIDYSGETTILNSVERAKINADGSLGPWQAVASMNATRHSLAAATAKGYIYALGGKGGNPGSRDKLSSVERAKVNADGSLGPWQFVTSMTTKHMGLAAVVVGEYLYALGGNDGDAILSSVERAKINADGSLDPWQVVTPMTTPRQTLAAAAVSDYL